jgi:glycine dehydrogenase subunit 1
VSADYPSLGAGLLVCATETRTPEDVEAYARALADIMKNAAAA